MKFTFHIRPGTPAQVNAGILANATIHVLDDAGQATLIELHEFVVRLGNDGNPYVTEPSRPWQSQGQTKYFRITRFPNEEQRKRIYAALIAEYRRIGQGGTRQDTAPAYAPPGSMANEIYGPPPTPEYAPAAPRTTPRQAPPANGPIDFQI